MNAHFHFLRAWVVAALGLACGLNGWGAPDASAAPTEFTVGGLKVLVKPRPSVQTVSIGVFFAGPRAGLTPQTVGIESLLLETMITGSERFPRAVLRADQARLATNLTTGFNRDYSVVAMACTREAFDQAFAVLADVIMHPVLAEADLAQVRARLVATAAEAGADADGELNRVVEEGIYAHHPYALRGTGTAESLRAITPAQLREYHHRLLEAANMRVVVVGNIDAADLRRKVKAAFAGLPPGESPEDGVPPLVFERPSVRRIPRDLKATYVKAVFAAPRLEDGDMPAFRVLLSLLGDRIFAQVRTKHNLSYAAAAELSLSAAPYGYFYFSTTSVNEATRLCLAEVATLKRELVSANDLKALRSNLLTRGYMAQESNAGQAGELIQTELIGGGRKTPPEAAYDAVTPEEIQKAARKWLTHFQFYLLGPESTPIDEASFREPSAE